MVNQVLDKQAILQKS